MRSEKKAGIHGKTKSGFTSWQKSQQYAECQGLDSQTRLLDLPLTRILKIRQISIEARLLISHGDSKRISVPSRTYVRKPY